MSDVRVRPFRRGDRDQLTMLVNAHAGAVVPGMSVSVNTVLGSLERQPGGFIVDPWVSEPSTVFTDTLMPGTTASAWALTSRVSWSRSPRRNGRT